jgi:uncharacterized protein
VAGVDGIPPAVTEETAAFWDAAREGRLVVERCVACGTHGFPPYGVCRACQHREVTPAEIDGAGVVYSFTVNHQRWLPDLEVPFTLVWVDFPDHDGVRIVGRLRGCDPDEVRIGMSVDVGFEDGPDGFAVPSFVARRQDP